MGRSGTSSDLDFERFTFVKIAHSEPRQLSHCSTAVISNDFIVLLVLS